jgi:hypothetical protein
VVPEAELGTVTHAEGLRALAEREGVPELVSVADASLGPPQGQNSLTILGNSSIIPLASKAKSYGLTGLARYNRFVVRYEF